MKPLCFKLDLILCLVPFIVRILSWTDSVKVLKPVLLFCQFRNNSNDINQNYFNSEKFHLNRDLASNRFLSLQSEAQVNRMCTETSFLLSIGWFGTALIIFHSLKLASRKLKRRFKQLIAFNCHVPYLVSILSKRGPRIKKLILSHEVGSWIFHPTNIKISKK